MSRRRPRSPAPLRSPRAICLLFAVEPVREESKTRDGEARGGGRRDGADRLEPGVRAYVADAFELVSLGGGGGGEEDQVVQAVFGDVEDGDAEAGEESDAARHEELAGGVLGVRGPRRRRRRVRRGRTGRGAGRRCARGRAREGPSAAGANRPTAGTPEGARRVARAEARATRRGADEARGREPDAGVAKRRDRPAGDRPIAAAFIVLARASL